MPRYIEKCGSERHMPLTTRKSEFSCFPQRPKAHGSVGGDLVALRDGEIFILILFRFDHAVALRELADLFH